MIRITLALLVLLQTVVANNPIDKNVRIFSEEKRLLELKYLDVKSLADSLGFKLESHDVTTEDGYILRVFRIPGKTDETLDVPKKVVFLQHGLMVTYETWFCYD